ncbi:hypothetical protein KSP40_PGU009044 [Platanthera guangdongensis]|uniref:Transmembrane protein n=1 Tax=Platanthera guangdongensis TaxID=2320717 RepID=A0ABR2N2L1_9ASPA
MLIEELQEERNSEASIFSLKKMWTKSRRRASSVVVLFFALLALVATFTTNTTVAAAAARLLHDEAQGSVSVDAVKNGFLGRSVLMESPQANGHPGPKSSSHIRSISTKSGKAKPAKPAAHKAGNPASTQEGCRTTHAHGRAAQARPARQRRRARHASGPARTRSRPVGPT